MALPKIGTLGQKVTDNGYLYQWTGVGWKNLGQQTANVANVVAISSKGVNVGNTTVNAVVGNASFIAANSTLSTKINTAGVTAGNSTVNSALTQTALTFVNTTAGNTSVTTVGVFAGNSTANNIFNKTGIYTTNSTGNVSVTAGAISVGNNTLITNGAIRVGNISSNILANSTQITIYGAIDNITGLIQTATINSTSFSQTANNALNLAGYPIANVVKTTGDYTVTGLISFTDGDITKPTSNVIFKGSDATGQQFKIYYDTTLHQSYYTGTSYSALNADALGNFPASAYELKASLAADVLLLKSANAIYADDSAKLGGVLAANYVNTSSNYTISGRHIHTGNLEIRSTNLVINTNATIWASGSKGTVGQILVATGSTVRWDDASAVVDQNADYDWRGVHKFIGDGQKWGNVVFGNSSVYANIYYTSSGVQFTGTANNANNLAGVAASSYALKTYTDSKAQAAWTNAISDILNTKLTYTAPVRYYNPDGGRVDLTIGTYYPTDVDYVSGSYPPDYVDFYANSTFAALTSYVHGNRNYGSYSYTAANIISTGITFSNTTYIYNTYGANYVNTYYSSVNTSTIYISNTSIVNPVNGPQTTAVKMFSANTTAISISNNSGYSANISQNQIIVGNSSLYTNTIGGRINFRSQAYTTSGAIGFSVPAGQVGTRNTLQVSTVTTPTITTINTALNSGAVPYFYINGVWTGTITGYSVSGGIATLTLNTSYTFALNDTILFSPYLTGLDGYVNTTSYTGEANSAVYFGGARSSAYVNTSGDFQIGGTLNFQKISANNDIGLGGQVLVSSGTEGNVYWSVVGGDNGLIGTVTRVSTANGLTGGPITGFGTLRVQPNTGIVANSSGLFVNTGYLDSVYGRRDGTTFTGAITIANDVSITGNLTLVGNSFVIGANNLVVNDAIISLHTKADLSPLTGNDGRLIGTAYHYYDTQDRQAMLVMNQTNTFLTYYNLSSDSLSSDPVGIGLGTIQANTFFAGNSSMAGSVRVGNSTIYGIISSNSSVSYYTGTANNAVNLAGLAATNYVTYSVAANYVRLDNTGSTTTLKGDYVFYGGGSGSPAGSIKLNTQVYANNHLPGGRNYVLSSGGSGPYDNVYWTSLSDLFGGAVRSLTAGDGLNGGTITDTGTISLNYGYGLDINSTSRAVYVKVGATDPAYPGITAANSLVVNSSGIYVNTSWLEYQAANNASYLGGVAASHYVQNTDSRILSGNLTFGTGSRGTNTVFNTNVAFNNYITTNIIPQTTDTQWIGNSGNRWVKLYVSGSGILDGIGNPIGAGIYIGNTYLSDDIGGTDALVVNSFISNTATIDNFVGNNVSLAQPLLANSGGTGINVYTAGDLIYASATNAFSTLSIPHGPTGSGIVANGQILQIVNNLPVWGGIDCGESDWVPL